MPSHRLSWAVIMFVGLGCSAQPAPDQAPPPAAVLAAAPPPAPAAPAPASCGSQAPGDPAHAGCGESACAGGGHSCGAEAAQAAVPLDEAQPAANGLMRVSGLGGVCMLSNRYLGERADVPIDVAGKTYRGCCAGCAARLASQPAARLAVDPVSGHAVDKASAVLARDATNRLYYFESEQTLARYVPR